MLLAGTIAGFNLVKQQLPNYDVPSIQVLLTYSGASTTEMRDAIVRPLEDQIAGAPDLSYMQSAIQPGQASIVAVFSLNSDQNTDLVQVQGRVQDSLHQLPSDLPTPQISIYNPSEAVVVSLIASSNTLSLGDLSAVVGNDIVPAIEQVPGVSYVQQNGDVTSSIQVNVKPDALRSSGFTLTDVVNAVANNNVRAPGGIVYEPSRETTLDVRGDITDVPSVAKLLLGNTTTFSSTSPSLSVYPWTALARLYRIGDVADVNDAYETQRVFAFSGGKPTIELDVQKAAGSSEVTASNAVLAELPRLRRQYPDVNFTVLNVQSTYTKELLFGRHADARLRNSLYGNRDAILPAMLAQRNRRHDCRSGLVPRYAGRNARSRLHARYRLALSDDADDRHSRRRLDRRAREYRAALPRRRSAARCRGQRLESDRRRDDRDHARHRGRLSSDLVPARIGGALLARVRFGCNRRNADVALRIVRGDARARRPMGALLEMEAVADRRSLHVVLRTVRDGGIPIARFPGAYNIARPSFGSPSEVSWPRCC